MNHNLTMVSSRLKFQLIQSEAVSMTVTERKVICQLFHGEEPVSVEKLLTLNSPDAVNINNRVYEVTMTLSKSVSGSMLELRIYDEDDAGRLNPIILDSLVSLPDPFGGKRSTDNDGKFHLIAGYPDETIQNLFCNSLMKVVKTCIM